MSTYLELEQRVSNRTFNMEPLFWKVLRETAEDPEKLAIAAMDKDVQDLFLDLTTRYNALDIRNCPENKPQLLRAVVIKQLPDEILTLWTTLTEYQQNFFINSYFLTPITDGRYKFLSELNGAETISTMPDAQDKVFYDFDDYVSGDGNIFFDDDIFAVEEVQSKQKSDTVTTPWGKTYDFVKVTLYANNMDYTESPLYNDYAGLVYSEDLSGYFDESTLYSVFVYNFYKVLYQGSTITGLQGFVNSLAGSPYILSEEEKVIRYEIVYIPGEGFVRRIFTDINSYDIPLAIPIGSWVQIGAVLPMFTPLGEYVVVDNYTTDPDWGHSEELDKTVNLTDKASGYTSCVVYDLETKYDFSEIEGADVEQRPRFDLAFSPVDYEGKLNTSTYGLWHKITGPVFVRFSFTTEALYDTFSDIFKIILRETVPIYIMYSVRLNAGLMDYLGGVLLDHDGEPLLDSLG